MQRTLLSILEHWFVYAEAYAILLAWIVVPLGYWTCFQFFQNHFGMFLPKR